MNVTQTIAAIATASAAGGIGIVRISGPDARAVADRVFTNPSGKTIADAPGYTALYGHITRQEQTVDRAIALVFAAPKSYTGEDVVELSCHGGPAILQQTLRLVLDAGARLAQPGEFTRRAFENGKLGLTEAEAIMDIVSARGEQAAKAAVAVHEGALSRRLNAAKEQLLSCAAWLGAWADFPEEDIPEVEPAALHSRLLPAEQELDDLIAGFDTGRILREGIDTVIVGSPNVGKSTLMNSLCGYESSIVTHIPGTTRDVVSEEILLGELRLHLADTAGIRQTDDTVEQFGVARAKARMEAAELIFAVFDGSVPLTEGDKELLAACKGRRAVAVINKNDLPAAVQAREIMPYIPRVVLLSAKEQTGKADLQKQVEDLFAANDFDVACGMLCNERQLACAKAAREQLTAAETALSSGITLDAVSVCLDGALEALMELTGERVTKEVADGVFHQFCVGK